MIRVQSKRTIHFLYTLCYWLGAGAIGVPIPFTDIMTDLQTRLPARRCEPGGSGLGCRVLTGGHECKTQRNVQLLYCCTRSSSESSACSGAGPGRTHVPKLSTGRG